MELELQSLRDQVARMTRKAGRVLALDTVRECIDVRHEWIFKNGLVVGHVLVADEGALVDALQSGDVLHASLDDVLSLPWVDHATRSPFAAQIESVFFYLREATEPGGYGSADERSGWQDSTAPGAQPNRVLGFRRNYHQAEKS